VSCREGSWKRRGEFGKGKEGDGSGRLVAGLEASSEFPGRLFFFQHATLAVGAPVLLRYQLICHISNMYSFQSVYI